VADEKIWKNLFTFGECSTYLSKNIDKNPKNVHGLKYNYPPSKNKKLLE